jgi:hypothetical protein
VNASKDKPEKGHYLAEELKITINRYRELESDLSSLTLFIQQHQDRKKMLMEVNG